MTRIVSVYALLWFLVASTSAFAQVGPSDGPPKEPPIADPTVVGCADGTREGYVDLQTYPAIASCGGAWDIPGAYPDAAACGRAAGNDGLNSAGKGCNVEDLCAQGWHICNGPKDVDSRTGGLGCQDAVAADYPNLGTGALGIADSTTTPATPITVPPGGAFFMTQASGSGFGVCEDQVNGSPVWFNDLFGCGNMGRVPASTCAPLNRFSGDTCRGLQDFGWSGSQDLDNPATDYGYVTADTWSWFCPGDGNNEAKQVTKRYPDRQGGVICCKDADPSLPEVCDGIDNDLDGLTDEYVTADGSTVTPGDSCAGEGTCGSWACSPGGGWICDGAPCDESVCDGIDNDLDGLTDEDYVPMDTKCGEGACAATGVTTCVAGVVSDGCTPGKPAADDQSCDGVDDDCDGLTDEDYVPMDTTCGAGACAATGVTTCVAGVVSDGCTPGKPAADDHSCDGVDDDCDGLTDEDYAPVETSCGTGGCAATGVTTCVAGVVSDTCVPGKPAADDHSCDGVDDDCDGVTDEDYAPVETSCGTGGCAATGVTTCVAGVVGDGCTPGKPAANDHSCDGVDDDCDGQTDEDYVAETLTCGVGTCAGEAQTSCVDGQVVGDCQPLADSAPCEDGDLCTLADSCSGGVCQAGEAKPCEAPNSCFAVSGCNSDTGACELAPVADAGQGPITLTSLGTLGGVTSTPHALNDAGVVVGESADDTGAPQAFRWEAGTMENIAPALASGQAVASAATAMDSMGHIAGWVEAPDGTTSIFHRDAGGDEVLWAIGSSTDSRFLPVVANDWVAGVGTDSGADVLARVQGMEGGYEVAALPTGASSLHVAAVTDTGVVVGDLTIDGAMSAFVWTADALTVLAPADMASSTAVGISGDLVAVEGTRADGTHAALVYTAGGAADALTALDSAADATVTAVEGMRLLGTRGDGATSAVVLWDWDAAAATATATDLVLPAGGSGAAPVALNAAGHAVVTYTTAFGATNTLFWALEDGAATDIGTLGGTTTTAVALSDGDHVVVAATTAGGQARAALWWPGSALRDLGVLPGTTTVAPVAVNAAGQAVGVAAYDGDDRGWISTAPETSCVVCGVDTGAPELTCPVYGAAIECVAGAGALDLGTASAWDDCGLPVTLSNDAPASFPVGTTAVTWTATDSEGNASSCVSNVTVVDTAAPALTCPEAHDVTPDDGVCGAALALAPAVDDACDPDGVTLVSDAPALFPVGTTTVTFTAVDAAGNKATCQTPVTVGAGQPRAISCDADATFEVPVDACQVDEVLTAQVVDQCMPTVTLTADTRAYSVGEHDVIFTADEGTANPLTCTTHLTVTDGTAPTVVCNAPTTLTNAELPAVIRATGEDNCAAAVTVADATCVDADGNAVDGCTVTMDGDTVGVVVDADAVPEGTTASYAVSWTATATDPSGNATTVDCSTTAEVTGNVAECGPGQVRNDQGECEDVEIPEPTCAPGWSLNEDGVCDKIVANGGGGCDAGGSGSGNALLWLLALAVLGWFVRRRHARHQASRSVASVVASVAALLTVWTMAVPAAQAQTNPLDGNVPAQLFEPAPGGTLNYVGVQGMQVLHHLDVAGGFYLNYAYEPLVLHRLSNGEQVDLLQHQVQLDATAALGLFDVLELGLSMPVTLFQQAGDAGHTLTPDENLSSTVLGDLRLYPKWKIFGPDKKAEGFGMALLTVLSVPSGDKKALQGAGGVTLEPRVAAEYLFSDRVRLAATLGYRIRFADDQQLFNIQVGNELTYGLGFEWRPDPEKWAVLLDLNGKVVADPNIDAQAEERPVELAAAGRYWPAANHAITFGLGRGLSEGYGTPGVRVFAGYNYTPAPVRDADGDGIVDRDDSCPMEPEDVDTFQDDDGCPDTDNDKDGIADVDDKCPMDAEDKDGFQDEDGCPETDNDGDGILDDVDKCPNEAEDMDGIDDADGCPETDGDGDGVLDDVDKCPNEAEDRDGVFDDDGCPETDGDDDGILDPEDACPMEPENMNGVADDDGCPDVNEEKCVIDLPKIHFKYDKAKIQKRSYSVLDDAVAVLKSYPDVKLVEIGGHTDSDGTARYNQKLSGKRAKAVVKYLKKHGIKGSRLRALGFGEYLPKVTPEKTKKDKEKNRRVEFRVLKWKGRDCSAQVPGKILLKRALKERKAQGQR